MLWVLFAILAVVAQSQLEDCKLKYYIVNTCEAKGNFSFSCYGSGEDCDVYYAPPGNGCNGESVISIGTVRETETRIYDGDFELSGGFCSNNQIGVSCDVNNTGKIIHLPRATDAATKFHIPFPTNTVPQNDCAIFALKSSAQVNISTNDSIVNPLSIDPFNSKKFDLRDIEQLATLTRIDSDNPVIVSCPGNFMFQPISSEPLLIVPQEEYVVSVVISDCSTNELIQDFSKVNVTFALRQNTSAESTCGYTNQSNSTEIQELKVNNISTECYFLIEPLDDVCVSISAVNSEYKLPPHVVGLPESKFSTRFVTSGNLVNTSSFSFSETTCSHFDNNENQRYANLLFAEGHPPGKVSYAQLTFKSFHVECENPVLMIVREVIETSAPTRIPFRIPILFGYQPEEMWKPWFDPNLQCSDSLSLTLAQTVPSIDVPTSLDDTNSAGFPSWTIPVVVVIPLVALAVAFAIKQGYCDTDFGANKDKKTKSEDDGIVYAEQVVGSKDNQLNHEGPCEIIYAEEVVGPEDDQLNNEEIYIQRENESKQSYRL